MEWQNCIEDAGPQLTVLELERSTCASPQVKICSSWGCFASAADRSIDFEDHYLTLLVADMCICIERYANTVCAACVLAGQWHAGEAPTCDVDQSFVCFLEA